MAQSFCVRVSAVRSIMIELSDALTNKVSVKLFPFGTAMAVNSLSAELPASTSSVTNWYLPLLLLVRPFTVATVLIFQLGLRVIVTLAVIDTPLASVAVLVPL